MNIRIPRVDEARAIATVRVQTWKTTYPGILPASVLEKLSIDRDEDFFRRAILGEIKNHFLFVCTDPQDGVVGFVSGGKHRQGDPEYTGEIYAIYVLKSHQGQGAGWLLMQSAAAQLIQAGYESMLLWALADNPAVGFYQHMEGIPVRQKEVDFDGQMLIEVALGWKDLKASIFMKTQ